jgi:2-desacetyl-2-hydroxyethyl bacteriochlorophyllide A dehydrogenase
MRAILIEKPETFRLVDVPVPVAGPGEVLVQLQALSLCNQHDLKVNHGGYRDNVYLEYGTPGFPGHEGAGVVTALGADVTDFVVGDHVVMSGLGGPPLYAEYVTRRTAEIVLVRSDVPFEHVAMAELFGCVHRAIHKVPSYAGKRVAVFGCGAAGLAAVQLANVAGAAQVTAIDVDPRRLQLAAELGAAATVDARDEAALQQLKQTGAEIVIECSGHKTAYRTACHVARESLVIFGYSEGVMEVPLWPLFDHELTIYNSKWLTTADLTAVVRLIESGAIRTAPLITHRFKFEQYPAAVAAVGRGEVIKAILQP